MQNDCRLKSGSGKRRFSRSGSGTARLPWPRARVDFVAISMQAKSCPVTKHGAA